MFDAMLDQSMMRKYKRVVEEEGNTSAINVNVEEGWELLVSKSGNPRRYRDALLKVECGYMVEGLIADFGRRHGVCGDALTDYVVSFLHKRLFGVDGGIPTIPQRRNSWVPTRMAKMKMMKTMKKMKMMKMMKKIAVVVKMGWQWRRRAWTTSDVQV